MIFYNNELQSQFEDSGYIRLNKFISSDAVNYLRKVYLETPNDLGVGFHATTHSNDIEYRKKVTNEISDAITPEVNKILRLYKPVVGTFTIKEPGVDSFFDFHLDWNMVDERKFTSVTVWVALDETNADNGNLWVLEQSNKWGFTYRASPGLLMFHNNLENSMHMKFKKTVLEMKAGDAIIYDHRLIHGSPPNMTNVIRMAVNMAYIPVVSSPIHYVYDSNKIRMFEVDNEFFHTCNTKDESALDKYQFLEEIEVSKVNLQQEVLNDLILGNN